MIEQIQNKEYFVVPRIETKVGVESDMDSVREKLKHHGNPIEFVLTKDYRLFLTDKGHDEIKRANGIGSDDVNTEGWVIREEGVLFFRYYAPESERFMHGDENLIPKNLKNAIKIQVEEFIRPRVTLLPFPKNGETQPQKKLKRFLLLLRKKFRIAKGLKRRLFPTTSASLKKYPKSKQKPEWKQRPMKSGRHFRQTAVPRQFCSLRISDFS